MTMFIVNTHKESSVGYLLKINFNGVKMRVFELRIYLSPQISIPNWSETLTKYIIQHIGTFKYFFFFEKEKNDLALQSSLIRHQFDGFFNVDELNQLTNYRFRLIFLFYIWNRHQKLFLPQSAHGLHWQTSLSMAFPFKLI